MSVTTSTQMMEAETFSKTLVFNFILTQLTAYKDVIVIDMET
jgi:hypothetical protein